MMQDQPAEFSSLKISRAGYVERGADRYLVVFKDGKREVVEAVSAAEAVEKCTPGDIRRVLNLAFVADKVLEKGVLTTASGEVFETRTTLEETLMEFQIADLLGMEVEIEVFVPCDLAEFSVLSRQTPMPREEVLITPDSVQAHELPPSVTVAEKQVEVLDPPSQNTLSPAERELTQEEVEALLKG